MRKLTVFTPTYNRGYILPQLYESLCRQTCKDFVWLVVDDGSNDNTECLFSEWQSAGIIDIRYIKQNNGGKMRAHNLGAQECDTELFVCVDSDDYLIDGAVEIIINKWNDVAEHQRVAGLLGYRQIYKDGSLTIPKLFPVKGTSGLHQLYDMGFSGDTTIVFRTDVIRQYRFPEIEGEKFITEAFAYDQIDKDYKYILLGVGLTICEYREDGYSVNTDKLKKDNPCGWALYYNQLPSLWPKEFIWNYKMRAYSLAYLFLSKRYGLFTMFRSKLKTAFSLPLSLRYYHLLSKHFSR